MDFPGEKNPNSKLPATNIMVWEVVSDWPCKIVSVKASTNCQWKPEEISKKTRLAV